MRGVVTGYMREEDELASKGERGTKEMLQPCLIYLHPISLVPGKGQTKAMPFLTAPKR